MDAWKKIDVDNEEINNRELHHLFLRFDHYIEKRVECKTTDTLYRERQIVYRQSWQHTLNRY